jgi:Arc/MetJ-type ribon-helix-helix transcriptional regulator
MAHVTIDAHGEFRCDCGNYPNAEGAYPVDAEGNDVPNDDLNIWCCDRCGVIFKATEDYKIGDCEIIGQRS